MDECMSIALSGILVAVPGPCPPGQQWTVNQELCLEAAAVVLVWETCTSPTGGGVGPLLRLPGSQRPPALGTGGSCAGPALRFPLLLANCLEPLSHHDCLHGRGDCTGELVSLCIDWFCSQ